MTPIETSHTSPSSLAPKILIIGPSWVGDMVMAQSLLTTLKTRAPETAIDVLAPAWSRPILERMPEVRRTLAMPLGHGTFGLKARWTLGKSLRQENYSQAIVLPNSWKSALIPWFAKIPLRTGWKGEQRYLLLNDLRHLDKQKLPMMVQRFVALANHKSDSKPLPIDLCPPPSLIANKGNTPGLQQKYQLSATKPVLILCPGAEFGPAKQWPAEHYRHTAAEMIKRGWQVWVMGSPADKMIAESICATLEPSATINLCGKTTLEEAIDLMSLADHVVSNDSGLMHIASALNKPLVALYGATSPQFTPPLSLTATILSITVDCGPCFKRQCPEGHHRCMKNLEPQAVLEKLNLNSPAEL